MKKISYLPIIIVVSVFLVALVIGVFVTANHHPAVKADNNKNTAAKSSTSSQTAKSISSSSSAAGGNTSASDAAVAAANTKPVTDACTLLSTNAATKILGGNAKQASADDTSAYQANGTTVTACAYAGTNGSTQLIVRTPTSSLGANENATKFGSGKPANAVTEKGFGQSAYWDPSKHQLNVLGDNNWYIITRSTNSQSDAEAVAKQLSQGF